MAYNFRSQQEAIKAMYDRVKDHRYIPLCELHAEVYVTPEPVPYAERTTGIKKVVKKGDIWGQKWDCGWFHITGTVPESAKGKKVLLYICINGEACIYDENGVAVQGLTHGHSFILPKQMSFKRREYVVTECAEGGEKVDLWMDAGANPMRNSETGRIDFMDMYICRDNVKDLFYDILVLSDLMEELPEDSARHHRLRQSLFEAACELYDFTDEEIAKASAILKKELDKKCGDTDLTLTAISNSHIDLAWLWPIRETRRKIIRTFVNSLRNMERYQDFHFIQSQPQMYAWLKEDQPEVYAQVKERVKEGRWETEGAMWCEPDANVTSGESFVRQILYGKRFFRKEFDKDPQILWLPDVFGYSAALPQILKKSGVPYFLTTKLGWGNRHNKHPHNTFQWKGIDGTEILAHMPPEGEYNSMVSPWTIKKIERNYADKCLCDEAMMLYGIGDGGGGPAEIHLEILKREKNLSGLIPVKQGKAREFFDRIAKNQDKYATFNGELYFEMHQGTYTTQGRNKWYNRKMEKLLREAEFAAVVTGSPYPKEKLDEIWKEVMLYQFHDILPGSSIKRVYDECLPRYAVLYDETKALIQQAYGKGEYAINSLSWDRTGWEKIDGKWYDLTVPAMGSIKLENGIASQEVSDNDCGLLENDAVKVTFDQDGAILSVYDKKAEKETLKAKSNRFAVYFDDGDAWDMNESYRERTPKYFELVKAESFIDGPEKGIRQEYAFGGSKLWQTVSIVEGSAIVRFDTKVDWNESEKMLRTAFYTTVVTDEVTCDIQYGSVKRPTHNNTSWDIAKFEICAHKYADLSDNNYGVALMNDSKYGYCVKDGMLDLNLLRSTGYPDEAADRAVHNFTYALYPHCGNVKESDVLQKSYELNQPLQTGKSVEQLFTVSNPDIIVESVKKAEDSDAVIIRMYETKGGNAATALKFTKTVKSAYLVDLMEENEKEIDLNNIPFHGFEIVTVKVNI
ncbi:MAG: alpha-mannosidase [Clostridia bacterium]|nr:alpha-mannosidase [Clostridia bacterium]